MIVCGMVLLLLCWTWLSITLSKSLGPDEQAKASRKFHELARQHLHLQTQEDRSVPFFCNGVDQRERPIPRVAPAIRPRPESAAKPKIVRKWPKQTLVAGGCLLWVITPNTA